MFKLDSLGEIILACGVPRIALVRSSWAYFDRCLCITSSRRVLSRLLSMLDALRFRRRQPLLWSTDPQTERDQEQVPFVDYPCSRHGGNFDRLLRCRIDSM